MKKEFQYLPFPDRVAFMCDIKDLEAHLIENKGEVIKYANGSVVIGDSSADYINSKAVPVSMEVEGEDDEIVGCFVPNEVMDMVASVDTEKAGLESAETEAQDIIEEVVQVGYNKGVYEVDPDTFVNEILISLGELAAAVADRDDVKIKFNLADVIIKSTWLAEKEVFKVQPIVQARLKQINSKL